VLVGNAASFQLPRVRPAGLSSTCTSCTIADAVSSSLFYCQVVLLHVLQILPRTSTSSLPSDQLQSAFDAPPATRLLDCTVKLLSTTFADLDHEHNRLAQCLIRSTRILNSQVEIVRYFFFLQLIWGKCRNFSERASIVVIQQSRKNLRRRNEFVTHRRGRRLRYSSALLISGRL
jgi:hypothetical protein